MVIVRLRGGLGNQMFQYAMGKRIALHYNTNVKLDLTSLLKKGKKDSRPYQLHIFNIDEEKKRVNYWSFKLSFEVII